MELVALADIKAAAARIKSVAVRTPLVPLTQLLVSNPDQPFWLKLENLQPTGAFKLRGALNALAQLSDAQREAGVVTHSSGNHGQALAFAGLIIGAKVVVVIPQDAPAVKIRACARYGAEVVLVPAAEREPKVAELAAEQGLTVIPPYDSVDIIAGQGTVGLEIAEELPKVKNVLVPVGGGGLISGVGAAVNALCPWTRVIGVEPELAADAKESMEAEAVVSWPIELRSRTIADGLRTQLSELTLEHIRTFVDDIVTVTEEEIEAAVGWLARNARIVAEPSGAVTTAAFLAGKVPGGLTAAVVSGGNVDPALYARIIAAGV